MPEHNLYSVDDINEPRLVTLTFHSGASFEIGVMSPDNAKDLLQNFLDGTRYYAVNSGDDFGVIHLGKVAMINFSKNYDD